MQSSRYESIDADDSGPSQLSVVEDSTQDESQSEATGESDSLKRTHENEAMVDTKKIRPSDQEIIDLLMAEELKSQIASNYSDSMESSPLSSPSISRASLLNYSQNYTNILDIAEVSNTEETSELNLDGPTSPTTRSLRPNFCDLSPILRPLSSPSISEVSQLNSPEHHRRNIHDISEDSDTEERSNLNSDESTSEMTTSQSESSITSPTISPLSSQSSTIVSLLSCNENYTNILDVSEDCDNEDPSELNRNILTSLPTTSLQISDIPPVLNPSSPKISEALELNYLENDTNIIDITEDSDVEEPRNLDMDEQEPRFSRSLQPVSSNTHTGLKRVSSTNISGISLLNCSTNDTNIIDITGDSDNENPSKTNKNILISKPISKAVCVVMPTVLSHPAPLPEAPNIRSLESWKLMPPCPTLTVKLCPESRELNKVRLEWNINTYGEEFAEIISYEIFYYEGIESKAPSTNLWQKVDQVQAIPLPMFCTLTCESEDPCKNQYFAIRAIDEYSRVGPFSSVQLIELI